VRPHRRLDRRGQPLRQSGVFSLILLLWTAHPRSAFAVGGKVRPSKPLTLYPLRD
jgi:hypothetical protein